MSEFSCKVIGKHLRDARTRLKLKQADVARMTYVSLPYYGKLERGEICPSIDRLARICKTLHLPLPDVFKGIATLEEVKLEKTPTETEFENFFSYIGNRVDDKTKAVMIEVCRQIAMLDE